jgi:alpha-amylase/alpha-mannosidase (GH57 family)
LKLEMPNCIRVEIRWNTITASDATDWPFCQNGKLGPVFQDETRKGPQIYRFLFHEETFPSFYIGESERFEGRARAYHRTLRLMRNGVPPKRQLRVLSALSSDCIRTQRPELVRQFKMQKQTVSKSNFN